MTHRTSAPDITTTTRAFVAEIVKEALGGVMMAPAVGGTLGAMLGAYTMFHYSFGFSAIVIGGVCGVALAVAYLIFDPL